LVPALFGQARDNLDFMHWPSPYLGMRAIYDVISGARHVLLPKGPSWILKFKRMYGKTLVTWYNPFTLIGYGPYQRY